MIKYVKGDVLASDEPRIAHGVNCSGGFKSGFAKAVADKYPIVKERYSSLFEAGGWSLGHTQLVEVDDGSGRLIANCGTQQRYGRPTEGPFVSYPAVREVIKKLVKTWPEGFAMPKMGAGLAGGNWDIIAQIIEEESATVEVRVYEL